MCSVNTNGGMHGRLATTKQQYRTWLLLACAVTAGVLVLFLGVRLLVQRNSSHGAGSLAAIGITPVAPPRFAPTLAFYDETGRALNLGDFKGRAVLLNVWATWCVPCRKEMPSLDRLQAKLGGPRFQVIAISIDKQGVAVVSPFYRELGLRSLGIYLDPSGKAPSAFGIDGVPATLLIDTDGHEIGRKLGALEWDSPAVIDALRKNLGLKDMMR